MLKERRRLLVIVAVLLLTAVTGMILLLTVFKDSEKPSKKAEESHKLRSFECKTYAVDGEKRELITERKQEVNENGVVIYNSVQSYNPGYDDESLLNITKYDDQGRIISDEYYEIDMDGKKIKGSRETYEYVDEKSDKRSVENSYRFRNDKEVLISKGTYEYYPTGEKASYKNEAFIGGYWSITEYNKEGQKVSLDYYENGRLEESERSEFDSNGKILSFKKNVSGEPEEYIEYRYDDRGVLIEKIVHKDDQMLYELSYDPKTKQVYKHIYLDDEITGVYTYDEKGRLVESLVNYNTRVDEAIDPSLLHNYVHLKYRYNADGTVECPSYDEDGNITEIDTYYSDGGIKRKEVFHENNTIIREYDSDGDSVLEEIIDENGVVLGRNIVEKSVSLSEYPGEKVRLEREYRADSSKELKISKETISRKMFLDGEEQYVEAYCYYMEDGEKKIKAEMKDGKDGKTIEFHQYYLDWDEDYAEYDSVKVYDEDRNILEEFERNTVTGEVRNRIVREYTYY